MPLPLSTTLLAIALVLALSNEAAIAWVLCGLAAANELVRYAFLVRRTPVEPESEGTYEIPARQRTPIGQQEVDDGEAE